MITRVEYIIYIVSIKIKYVSPVQHVIMSPQYDLKCVDICRRTKPSLS